MNKPKNLRDESMDINERLDLEAQADALKIKVTNQVGVDCATVFGGRPPYDRVVSR